MGRMGEFLASKKGKTSVKASADTALKAASQPEGDASTDLLEALKTTVKETDDWGVDSDSETGPIAPGSAVVGGHFHLISEEDVKPAQRRPKKWGEVEARPAEKVEQKVEEKAEPPKPAETEPELPPIYVYRRPPTFNIAAENFPALGETEVQPAAPVAAKKKKALTKNTDKPVRSQPADSDPSAQASEQSAPVESRVGIHLMLISEFLKDLTRPNFNVAFSDEASDAKFYGRSKRPFIPLSAADV